ncbi:helix-turn-helix domain-containing protein [Actinotalea subterranea]|uniref:helix-turn-helix domain-containing protein n=1 Tax=Actinotalea subterranea TaxID=2607497 RepID=UPI0011EC9398|nr:AraC family transcriptional regulator [Actinotalea subterranea]
MSGRQQTIGRLDAVHPDRAELGVCLAALKPTGGCMDRSRASDLLRTDFHIVILCSAGSAEQLVDLDVHHHAPGSLLWIRPGQVHERPPTVEGTAICFTDDFLGQDPAAARTGPTSWLLAGDDLADVRAHLDVLDREYRRYVFGPTGQHLTRGDAMLRHLLQALLLRVAQAPSLFSGRPLEPHPVARAFLELVERSFGSIHTVEDYAVALGYSSKTLGRASVEATGLTPKQVIDARLVREARRLLAYTDLPVGVVGRRLGFEDPANFCRFFVRATGLSPGACRATFRG